MTTPISSVPIQQQIDKPLAVGAQNIKAGYFVINPPNIQPYSFYNDLKKGDNYFYEMLKIFASKEMPSLKVAETSSKKMSTTKKILLSVLTVGGLAIVYKKWDVIVNFFKNLKK